MTESSTFLAALFVYLLAGAVVGVGLAQRGHAPATSASAVIAWPLLATLLAGDVAAAVAPTSTGPFGARIHAVINALLTSVSASPDSAALARELGPLADALLAADQRLAGADALLASTPDTSVAAYHHLVEARSRAAADIEEVLTAIVELRLHIGLLALAGNTAGVREQLTALRQRASALAEVHRLVSP